MSENQRTKESRLDRAEARHVKLMAQHEVFWAHHQESVAQQERNWARHDAWVVEQERAWERERELRRERDAALDARIDKLVSGIGTFIANANK